MGKNQSASNLTNIIKQDASGNIAFMSGSTMLMSLSTTGQMSGSSPAMSAVTASYADNFTVKGTLTAQTIVSQVVTSSTSLVTGSTMFGTSLANTHAFTGSVLVTGSITGSNALFNLSTAGGFIIKGAAATPPNLSYLSNNYFPKFYTRPDQNFGITVFDQSQATAIQSADLVAGVSASALLLNPYGGKVGIGTTNADNSYQGLTMYGSDPSLRLKTSSSSGWTWIEFVNNSGTNNFSMGVNQTTPFFGIKAGAGMDNTNFTMLSSGNVGIGTTNPADKLEVYSSTYNKIKTFFEGSYTSGFKFSDYNGGIKYDAATDRLTLFANYAGDAEITFDTVSTERMRITSTGAVGIGTTTIPYSNYKLIAKVTSDRNISLGYQGTDCSIEAFNDAVNSNVPLRIYGNNIMLLGGSVGVGTTNPAGYKLFTSGDVGMSGNNFYQNEVTRVILAGTINGNASISFIINCASQSSVKVTCVMNHYGYINGYGCARMSLLANGPTFDEVNISNTTSANGGSWSFSRIDSTRFYVTKNAGSYGGGGLYFVEVIGNSVWY